MFVVIKFVHLVGKKMVYAEAALKCEEDLTTLISCIGLLFSRRTAVLKNPQHAAVTAYKMESLPIHCIVAVKRYF